ncbi:MAG: hypothetical protein ACOCQR_03765, partial [bacterium]
MNNLKIPLQLFSGESQHHLERHDDIRVVDSFIEYNEDSGVAEFIIYRIMLREDGEEWQELYKVVKLARLMRIPKKFRELSTLMDLHDEIFTGLWARKINFINVIANILKPPIGLLFLYGVQELDADLETAKEMANDSYEAVYRQFKGTIPQIRLRELEIEEANWLREKMFSMKHLQIVRGIPMNKANAAHGTESSMSGEMGESDAQ